MSENLIFRVIFNNQGKIYEVYAKGVDQGVMFGFVEIEELVFGGKTSVVVDPAEESLKAQFKDVKRTYIPMHSIIRIDEVSKEGTAKITDATTNGSNVMPFPVYTHSTDPE